MTDLGGHRHRRQWKWMGAACGVLVLASAVYAVRQIARGGLEPADTASLLALPLGAAGLIAALAALNRPVTGNDAEAARGWAATLARQVLDGEGRVRRQLLGDDIPRINLTYVLRSGGNRAAAALPGGQTFAERDGDSIPDAVAYYRSARPRRLVISGSAGAGKTVLALELLLGLIEDHSEDDPVPIRVPLTLWDPTVPLPDLLAQRLVEAYDWPTDLAARLVAQGLVLPVLDGLDEMDSLLPNGSPDPRAPRANTALSALNAYQVGREAGSLILTCRTGHYTAVAGAGGLLDAAHVTITRVDADQAITYLRTRARDVGRWQSLLYHLQSHPVDPLVQTLSTPWRLCLIATVYHDDGDPADILQHTTPAQLDEYLLARYIPAATRTTPSPSNYTAEDVHHWLHHLSTHLTSTQQRGNITTTDFVGAVSVEAACATELALDKLWPLAGRTRVRTTDAFLTMFLTLLPLPLTWTTPDPAPVLVVITALAVLNGVAAATPTSLHVHRLNRNRIRTQGGRRDLAIGMTVGLVVGLMVGLTASPTAGIATGLIAGLTGGLVTGLTAGLDEEPTSVVDPRVVMRQNTTHGLVIGLVSGLATALAVSLTAGLMAGPAAGLVVGLATGVAVSMAFGLLFGLMAGLTAGLTTGLTTSFTAGLTIGLTAGLAFGLTAGLTAVRRYAVFLLRSRSQLPFRLARFLTWACDAGLMRYSGPAYQFRHREFQQWLSTHPDPEPHPRGEVRPDRQRPPC